MAYMECLGQGFHGWPKREHQPKPSTELLAHWHYLGENAAAEVCRCRGMISYDALETMPMILGLYWVSRSNTSLQNPSAKLEETLSSAVGAWVVVFLG